MEQLALRTNCSVGTLYKPSRDKEALLRVLTDEAVREILQDLDTDLARALTKSDTLSVALRDIVNFLVNLFRHREMLILAIFKRQFDDPQATAALMATRMAVVDTALAKILAVRPRGMTAADFSWRFRVGMVPDLSSKDPIAIDILVLVHDVTDMDTDRQFNDIVTFQALLDVQRTTNRVNRRGEFHQPAVPHALDNLATVGGHHRFKQFTAQLP